MFWSHGLSPPVSDMRICAIENLIRGTVLAVATLLTASLGAPLAAVELVPHRAVYDIKLASAKAGGNVVAARGLTTMALERGCEGWIIVQRMFMQVDLASGRTSEQDMRYSGWESLDGKRYRFSVYSLAGGKRENFLGSARAAADGGSGEAIFKEPRAETFGLSADTLFPVSHTRLLIDRARAGDRQVARHVFDGTEVKEPQKVVAFIGPGKGPDEHAYGAVGLLARRPGWNIRMGFYDAGSTAPEPEFEIDMLQLDNGVVPHLTLDYMDFSVVLELQRLESLPAPVC